MQRSPPGAPAAPPDGFTFSLPARHRRRAQFVALGCAVGVVACFALPLLVPGSFDALYAAFAGALLLGAVGLWSAGLSRDLRTTYRIEPWGMIRNDVDAGITGVSWGDVAATRERPVLRRLDLLDAKGGPLLALDYDIEDFDRLLSLIGAGLAEGRLDLDKPAPPPARAVFTRSWSLRILAPLLVVGAPLLSIGLYGGVLFTAWGFALGGAVGWLLDTTRVRVERGGLIAERPFRKRRIAAREIDEIVLTMTNEHPAQPVVYVVPSDGRRLVLDGMQGGVLPLYLALRRVATSARGERA